MSRFYETATLLAEEHKRKAKRLFNNSRLDLMKFDELNPMSVTTNVTRLYDTLSKQVDDYFLEIQEEIKEAEKVSLKGYAPINFKESFDPVMMFVFANEVERKRSRYAESIMAQMNGKKPVDVLSNADALDNMTRNLNVWTNQVSEGLANFERECRLEAWKEKGTEYVEWVAQIGCCPTCDELNGQIFPINDVPPLAHPHCRCEVKPVSEQFRRENDENEYISERRFNELTIEVKKMGAIIKKDEESEAHLAKVGASASTIGDIIMFRKNVTISDVLEETFHFMQNKRNAFKEYDEGTRKILMEIEAKEYLLSLKGTYNIPQRELENTKMQLEDYKKQLDERKKNGYY